MFWLTRTIKELSTNYVHYTKKKKEKKKTLYINYPAYIRCILYSKITFGRCTKIIALSETYSNLERESGIFKMLSFVMNSDVRARQFQIEIRHLKQCD